MIVRYGEVVEQQRQSINGTVDSIEGEKQSRMPEGKDGSTYNVCVCVSSCRPSALIKQIVGGIQGFPWG